MQLKRMGLFSRWIVFIKERFPLFKHFLLIFFYFTANTLMAISMSGLEFNQVQPKVIAGFLVVFFVFFHLRIFDEIKDFKSDLESHPNRPLARGFITIAEAKKTAGLLIFAEIILSAFIGIPALIAILCTIVYSLIMYKEFFIDYWLRLRLATYALCHTLIACWMSVFIFSAVTDKNFWLIPKGYGLFVLTNWMIFNVFEFGRKTFGKGEEKREISSYSKKLGSVRAAGNVIFMAAVASIIAFIIGIQLGFNFLFFGMVFLLFLAVLIFSFFYGRSNSIFWARRFRTCCSTFILLYNVIIVTGVLTKGNL